MHFLPRVALISLPDSFLSGLAALTLGYRYFARTGRGDILHVAFLGPGGGRCPPLPGATNRSPLVGLGTIFISPRIKIRSFIRQLTEIPDGIRVQRISDGIWALRIFPPEGVNINDPR